MKTLALCLVVLLAGCMDEITAESMQATRAAREGPWTGDDVTIVRRDMGDATCFISHHSAKSPGSYQLSCIPKVEIR